MGENYTVIHLHSMFSNGVTNVDSITDYKQYIARAKELGMKAMCFTEHGSVFSWLHKKEEIEKAGMKYIHGIEAYVTETLYEKVRDNYHCVLIAKNYDGVLELNTLVSNSFNRQDGHFYYVPRITLEELENTSDNIIVSTACLGGILNKGTDTARDRFISFLWNNKHRCFLEIQHHMVEDQIKYNKYLYELSKSICVPLIAGTDTHALNDEHLEGRAILQKAKNVNFAEEQAWDLTFKSYEELVEAYEKQKSLPMDVVHTAINNTNVLADMIEEFTIDRSYKYPHLWQNPEETFRKKIEDGIKWRGVDKYPNYQEYLDRIEYEMKAYVHNQAIDFMLLMDDIISWCKTQDIQVGYGRGSVNGSVIAWLLGITEMDSIKHKLNFDRFMNVERVSLSDIDTDFPPSRIEDVKNYIFNRHGLYCSDIITFNTIADKGAIRDVGRALGIPLSEVGEICDAMDSEERTKSVREKYPLLFKYVDLVKGTIVSIGSHPCGTIVCGFEFSDKIGVCSTATSNYRVSQLNMKEVDSLNYVKLDLLKLDTIELINETCKLAGIPRVTPDNLDITDMKVWKALRDNTTEIFQFSSATGQDYIRKLLSDETLKKFQAEVKDIDMMTLLSIGNGAIRPAGASYRDDLANGVIRKTGAKPIDDFLADTFGCIVFQEDILAFLHNYCGFTMGEADVVRRCVDENTLVKLKNGKNIPIKDITVGDEVVCFDDDGRSTTAIVNNVYDNGYQDTKIIKTNNQYQLIATGTHKVLTQRGYVEVKDLTIDDYIMVPRKISKYVENIRPNQRLSSTDMFLIGMLIGDGSLSGEGVVAFTNHEMKLIDKFKECVNGRLRKKASCEFTMSWCDGVTVDRVYRVGIKSKEYKKATIDLIKNLGLNVLSAKKHIPECLMNYPYDEKLFNLLGGLFTTDGGYNSTSKCIEYSSISEELVLDIQSLLQGAGIYSYVQKKNVKNYGYTSYSVCINQKESLHKFDSLVVSHMVGVKKELFRKTIKRSIETPLAYNYILPHECTEEIINSCVAEGKSFNAIGERVHIESSLTDEKARRLTNEFYCPYTYKILHSDYIPMKIKSIKDGKKSHVYDIEVNTYHNYVANGMIVHNCFAKKLGTREKIPIIVNGGYMTEEKKHYIPGYIALMKERYGIDEKKSEKDIIAFIKVIEDASDYLFSRNHSTPYSYEGYACAWLRTYYPLEFITTALNIVADKEDRTREDTLYAKSLGIKFKPPEFGYSRAGYYCNKEENAIYKGIGSLKFMTDAVANEISQMYDKPLNDFVDILYYMKHYTSVNSRQIDILIKIDFFKKYGEINKLLYINEMFQQLSGKQGIKKDAAQKLGIPEDILRRFSENESITRVENMDFDGYCALKNIDYQEALRNCPKYKHERDEYGTLVKTVIGINFNKFINEYCVSEEDQFKFATKIVYGKFDGLYVPGVLKYLSENSDVRPCSLSERLKYQINHLGYVDYVNPDIKDNRHICVTALDTTYSPKFQAYNLRTGGTCEVKVHSRPNRRDKSYTVSFQQIPFENGDVLYMKQCVKKLKQKKNANGEWEDVPGEFNWWITDYTKIYDL